MSDTASRPTSITLRSEALAEPEHRRASDSARNTVIVGLAIFAAFFGGFGTWALTAPLNGAVVAQGVVKVEGNRKSVQHLDGGIVKELRVQEGQHVRQGDVLIVLNASQARAEYEVLSQQYLVLRAAEVRLLTELAHGAKLEMPGELWAHAGDAYVQSIWAGQVKQFESRNAALEGQRSVIQEKIGQLQSQITGAQAQVKAFDDQIASAKGELQSIAPLVEKNLIARPRLLQLERSIYQLDGQAADARASVAKFRQAVAEQQLQIAQLDNERMTDVTKDLRETQARLLEVIPKRIAAEAVLGRMEIRAPYSGKVVALNVFSVGGVIQRGDKILDIVPDDDALAIDAQVAVEDISEVHPDMVAEVQLTAYKARIVPVVHGKVVEVSADRLTDQKTGNPYYVASIRLDAKELAELPMVRLYPGMPANVMIPTEARTAFDYFVGPLMMSFNKAFRQK
jgi:epimerase transport system membrane fusion protein